MEVWLDLLRRMTPGEKLAATFRLTDLALRAMDAEVRAKYPDATGHEVKMRVASRHLSRELMIAAYDWDPLAHGRARHRGPADLQRSSGSGLRLPVG